MGTVWTLLECYGASFLLFKIISKISHFRGKIEFIFWQKIGFAVYIKINNYNFNIKLKYEDLNIYLLHAVAGFMKIPISIH